MIKVAIDYAPDIRGMKLWVWDERPDGEYFFNGVQISETKLDFGMSPEPTMVFPYRRGNEFLQQLSTALSKAGFIPDEVKESESKIDAIKYHLEDMRRLVFKDKK